MIVFSRGRIGRSLSLRLRTNFVLALRWSSGLFAHHKLAANDKVKVSIRTLCYQQWHRLRRVLSEELAGREIPKLNSAKIAFQVDFAGANKKKRLGRQKSRPRAARVPKMTEKVTEVISQRLTSLFQASGSSCQSKYVLCDHLDSTPTAFHSRFHFLQHHPFNWYTSRLQNCT